MHYQNFKLAASDVIDKIVCLPWHYAQKTGTVASFETLFSTAEILRFLKIKCLSTLLKNTSYGRGCLAEKNKTTTLLG